MTGLVVAMGGLVASIASVISGVAALKAATVQAQLAAAKGG